MLRAEHITKQYSLPDSGHTVFDAVSDVSLELKGGCVSSLVGESGSGKSTLARVLSYIELPDIGKVFLGDLEVTSCKRKEIRSVRGKVTTGNAERPGFVRSPSKRCRHSGGTSTTPVSYESPR